jgi:hypothetical protein
MKATIKKFMVLSVTVLLFSICGCGGSGVDTQNYQDPVFETYKVNTIGILPIRNSNLALNEAREVNRYFMTGIARKNKKYILISPEESIEKLNRDSLVERYYNHLVTYSSSGIANTKTLQDIGKSIGCDAIAQGEIYNVIKKDGHYGQNKGETRCNVRYSVLSTKDGKVLWETSVESYDITDFTTSGAPPLMDVVKAGMDKIIESLPGNK